jgi:hypothetical protein
MDAVGFVGRLVGSFGGRQSRESHDGMNGVVLFFLGGCNVAFGDGVRGARETPRVGWD